MLRSQFYLPSLGIRYAASMRRLDKTDHEAELSHDDEILVVITFFKSEL